MNELILALIAACRRSRVKLRVLRALVRMKVALETELADAAQTTPERVEAVMIGDRRDYRRATGLVTLGISRRHETKAGVSYSLTREGESAWMKANPRLRRGRANG